MPPLQYPGPATSVSVHVTAGGDGGGGDGGGGDGGGDGGGEGGGSDGGGGRINVTDA